MAGLEAPVLAIINRADSLLVNSTVERDRLLIAAPTRVVKRC
jgi:hypothetical protein